MTSEITMQISDILDRSELKDIAEEEVRRAVREELKTANDRERFVGNVAHLFWEELMSDIVAEIPDFKEQLTARIKGSIRDNKMYGLFQHADGYLRRTPTLAQQYVDEIVASKKAVIQARAESLLSTFELGVMQEVLVDQLKELFSTNKGAKDA